jgi:hypothetical protein
MVRRPTNGMTRLLLATVVAVLGLAGAMPAYAEEPVRPVVVEVEDGGFHWADALIGAAAGAGLGLAIAGLVVLSYRSQFDKGGM